MKKGLFNRENIEKIVRLLPRPTMHGKPIARSRNCWLILQEYGDGEGIEILNKITNHGGQIPYDSLREWREPDMVILSAQLNLGKDGIFELAPFLDGPETDMLTEEEEHLPERVAWVKDRLHVCTPEHLALLKQLLIQETMEQGEIVAFLSKHGVREPYPAFADLSGRTSFLDVGDRQKVWIKPAVVPILRQLLFPRKTDSVITPPPAPHSS